MKVHMAIGHTRSLCGMSPQHGNYDIRSLSTFFHSADSDQCERCLHYFNQRGYSITKARAAARFQPVPRAQIVADRAVCYG